LERFVVRMTPFFLQLLGTLFFAFALFAWMPFISTDMRLDLVGVCFFVVLGGALYLVGVWLDRKLGPWKPKPIASPTPGDTRFIARILTRERRRNLIFGIALLAFDALIIFAERADDGGNHPAHPAIVAELFVITLMTLFELLMLALGVAGLYRALTLWNIENTEIYNILTKTPQKVTGLTRHVFLSKLHVGSRGRQIMVALNVQNKVFRLSVSAEQFVALKQFIRDHNPEATYSEEEHEVH
jgi:hypothetical protein